MEPSLLKGKNVDVLVWAELHEVESQALTQLRNITTLPVVRHVAVMPDVHYGKGCTVGSVVAMKGAVSPAAVGVDIGCGMLAAQTGLVASDLGDSLKPLRSAIEGRIPVGFNEHATHIDNRVSGHLEKDAMALVSTFKDLTPEVKDLTGKAMRQLGTLGGGNHFIEVCLDTEQNVWVMLHSGSRNIGKTLAEKHIYVAQKLNHNQALVDRDLAYFLAGTPEMKAYRHDLFWAQRYALLNRLVMLELVRSAFYDIFGFDGGDHDGPFIDFDDPIQCHHNYVAEETHFGEDLIVTRKGAISARKGEMGIIPGSMGTRSYIVRGLGSEQSLHSASHGAGRRMSRGAAKRQFSVADLEAQTAGVECRKDATVLDEIPSAYKDIDKVLEAQSDLVEVVAQLKQVLCVKG